MQEPSDCRPCGAHSVHRRVDIRALGLLLVAAHVVALGGGAMGAEAPLPEGVVNSQPPGAPPPSGEKVLASMRLPQGFSATLFAEEPFVQQPIGFDFDDRGRLWVAESYTYPEWKQGRQSGVDRLIILEDGDGDGRHDKRTVFAEGLRNLTSVACASDGVWLICAPDLVFLPDANRDDKPDGPAERRLTGFEHDKIKHNIASNLTWGPDGWLYGLHGIQARSMIETLDAKGHAMQAEAVPLECGLWRYDTKRRNFEPVCFGTTNPFGVDFNEQGEAFFTNCVIGHLWQAIPGAHFKRMYGPDIHGHENLLDTCADHLHWGGGAWQESRAAIDIHSIAGGGHAHCGSMIYLGDNWPSEYRGKLFTINLHGRRLNCDLLESRGSAYVGRHQPDMVFVDNPWFRGVTLKYGPDGAVYISDWTDQGECHDDDGVHRNSGRIYKVVYGKTEHRPFDLRTASNEKLFELLAHKNAWFARHAQRILYERVLHPGNETDRQALLQALQSLLQSTKDFAVWQAAMRVVMAYEPEEAASAEMHAAANALLQRYAVDAASRFSHLDVVLFCLGAAPRFPIDNWGAPNHPLFTPEVQRNIRARLKMFSALSAAGRGVSSSSGALHHNQERLLNNAFALIQPLPEIADEASDYAMLHMYEMALHDLFRAQGSPKEAAQSRPFFELLKNCKSPYLRNALVRVAIRQADMESFPAAYLDGALALQDSADLASFLNAMRDAYHAARGMQRAPWEDSEKQSKAFAQLLAHPHALVKKAALQLGVVLGDETAIALATRLAKEAATAQTSAPQAVEEYQLLMQSPYANHAELAAMGLKSQSLREVALHHLAKANGPDIQQEIDKFNALPSPEQDLIVSALVTKPTLINGLVTAMEEKKIPPAAVSVFAARQAMARDDEALKTRFRAVWGELRDTRAEAKALLVKHQTQLAELSSPADVLRGEQVFTRNCRNCHKMFGQGGEMGPELTGADRRNADYVLLNVLDPSASVSTRYKLVNLQLADGSILSGVIQNENGGVITLKTVNGPVLVARHDIEEVVETGLSPMPEGLLDRLTPDELRDLLAYLALENTQQPNR